MKLDEATRNYLDNGFQVVVMNRDELGGNADSLECVCQRNPAAVQYVKTVLWPLTRERDHRTIIGCMILELDPDPVVIEALRNLNYTDYDFGECTANVVRVVERLVQAYQTFLVPSSNLATETLSTSGKLPLEVQVSLDGMLRLLGQRWINPTESVCELLVKCCTTSPEAANYLTQVFLNSSNPWDRDRFGIVLIEFSENLEVRRGLKELGWQSHDFRLTRKGDRLERLCRFMERDKARIPDQLIQLMLLGDYRRLPVSAELKKDSDRIFNSLTEEVCQLGMGESIDLKRYFKLFESLLLKHYVAVDYLHDKLSSLTDLQEVTAVGFSILLEEASWRAQEALLAVGWSKEDLKETDLSKIIERFQILRKGSMDASVTRSQNFPPGSQQ